VHSDQSRANAVLASEADRFALAQTAPASQQLTVDGKPVLEAIAPIVVGGEPWGAVRFGLSLERLERDVARAQAAARADMQRGVASSIAAALLLGALAAFVGTFAAGRIVTPLQRLLDGVRSVREGDLEHRVEVAGSREIAELGGAYNEMTERLSSLLADMAAKASLERELGVARSVQQNMIPTADLHRVGGFVLVGHCEMAENCGGDWWGFHQLADGRLLVVIGDATGHGLPAAIIAATARGALQAAVTVNPAITPRAALEAIDRAIRDAGKEQILMTACAIALGADGRSVEFANAGHVLPLTCARDDAAAVNLGVLAARGAPLGSPTLHIGMRAATLPPGTVLVLMTDGLRERFNGARVMYGDRRLHRLLRQSPLGEDPRELCELRDHILDSVKGFAGDAVPDDDLTIVLCRGGDDHADDRPAPVVSEPDDLAARPTSSPGPA
jgi:sigma-B regulation protein RsbU (phosphoserine phosphatase)